LHDGADAIDQSREGSGFGRGLRLGRARIDGGGHGRIETSGASGDSPERAPAHFQSDEAASPLANFVLDAAKD